MYRSLMCTHLYPMVVISDWASLYVTSVDLLMQQLFELFCLLK